MGIHSLLSTSFLSPIGQALHSALRILGYQLCLKSSLSEPSSHRLPLVPLLRPSLGRSGGYYYRRRAASRLKLKRLPSLEDIPLGPFLRKGIGIRIWQWIQILDYADSYAYFVDYDAEGSIALLLFKILYLYLELVHKSFPFMRFGRAWFRFQRSRFELALFELKRK